nr:Hypothetical protein [Oryza sativa]
MAGIIEGGSSVAEGELRTVVAGRDGEGTSKQRQQAGTMEPARSGGGGAKNGGGGARLLLCVLAAKAHAGLLRGAPYEHHRPVHRRRFPFRPSPPASVARAPPPPPLESHRPQLHSSSTAATATRSSPVVVVIAFRLGARATSAVAQPHP